MTPPQTAAIASHVAANGIAPRRVSFALVTAITSKREAAPAGIHHVVEAALESGTAIGVVGKEAVVDADAVGAGP